MTDSTALGAIEGPVSRSTGVATSGPLLAANMIEATLPLLRNIVLAHLISPTQFGLAISLSVVMGIVEVLTDLGLPVYAVGKATILPEPVVMASVQSLAIVRAVIIAAGLMVAAPLLASLFGAPQATWAYLALGAIAAVRGFEHFGVKAMMRDFRFAREAVVLATAQIAGAAVAIAAALATHGFACVLWGMAVTSAVTVLMSHLLAITPYRLGWNKEALRDVAAFSRPLLLNGCAVAINLSDRLLIGTVLSPSVLALYNVAVGTATLPKSVLAKFLTSAFLPMFVERRERRESARHLFQVWVWCLSILGFGYGFGLDLFGREALGLVFGAAYAPTRVFMSAVAIGICVKFLMLLPVPSAYAEGRTRNVTLASTLSAAAMLIAFLVLFVSRSLVLFAFAVGIVEFAGLLVLTRTTRRATEGDPAVWLAVVLPFLPLGALAAIAGTCPNLGLATWATVCGSVAVVTAATYATALARYWPGHRRLMFDQVTG